MTEAHAGETTKLIRMANQIAGFFRAYPEAVAEEGIRTHMQSFWTPRMLRELRADIDDAALDPLVRKAIK